MSDSTTDLEIKVSFLEHHVRELDDILRATIAQVENLQRDLDEVRRERSAASVLGSPEEEVPPHHVHL